MCFSAPASFIASAGLLAAGTVAVSRSANTQQRFLAAIPIIFAVQQLGEGLLWLSLLHPEYAGWRAPATFVFLLFAQVLWPVFVPLTVLLFEEVPVRRKILRFLLGCGVITAVYFGWCLLVYHPTASAQGHHIVYATDDYPFSGKWYGGITYILAAVVAPFISGSKRLRVLGGIMLASYIVSRVFYEQYLVSVWCYFAAVLSIIILVIIRQLNAKKSKA